MEDVCYSLELWSDDINYNYKRYHSTHIRFFYVETIISIITPTIRKLQPSLTWFKFIVTAMKTSLSIKNLSDCKAASGNRFSVIVRFSLSVRTEEAVSITLPLNSGRAGADMRGDALFSFSYEGLGQSTISK